MDVHDRYFRAQLGNYIPNLVIGPIVSIEDCGYHYFGAKSRCEAGYHVQDLPWRESPGRNDREISTVCYRVLPQLPREQCNCIEVSPFYEDCPLCLCELGKRGIKVGPQIAEHLLQLRRILDVLRTLVASIHDQQRRSVDFRDDLSRMGCNQDVWTEGLEKREELSLKIRMEIDIWFINR